MGEFLNLTDAFYEGVGEYGVPELARVESVDIKKWKTFNYAMNTKLPPKTGITFFIWDQQFERVWNYPNRYVEVLKKFDAVLQPDFSTYIDFPKAVQVFNHYRNQWVARYWQEHGLTVIPTIEWGTKESYEWCFDGVPEDSIVAVSNVGCMNKKEHRQLFMDGWNEMLVRLQPRKILLFAQKLDDYKGNWEHIPYDFSITSDDEEFKPSASGMPLFDDLPIF